VPGAAAAQGGVTTEETTEEVMENSEPSVTVTETITQPGEIIGYRVAAVVEGEELAAVEVREREGDGGYDLLDEPSDASVNLRAPPAANQLAVGRADEEKEGERGGPEGHPKRDGQGVVHRGDRGACPTMTCSDSTSSLLACFLFSRRRRLVNSILSR
jgi:hypothetical protein